MYIDNILNEHVNKIVVLYMKSGSSHRGRITQMDAMCHVVYLSRDMSGYWVTMIDTRNVESVQIEESQLDSNFVKYVYKE